MRARTFSCSAASSFIPSLSLTNSGMKKPPPGKSRFTINESSIPHTVAIQGCVGAPQHEAAAAGVDFEEVAVPPNPGVLVEIRFAIAGAVRVVPEADGHGRQRPRDHQLTDLIDH